MIPFNPKILAFGIERRGSLLKIAAVQKKYRHLVLKELFSIDLTSEKIDVLLKDHPILITALSGKEILVRTIELPLTKDKDIVEALPFQAEPLLPYPMEEAILTYQVLEKGEDSTTIALLSTRKEILQKYLEEWQKIPIEPEQVSSIPAALSRFSETYLPFDKKYLVLHTQKDCMTCILTQGGKLIASFSHPEGLDVLNQTTTFEEGLKRLQKGVTKVCYALAKEAEGEPIEGIVVTGEAAETEHLSSSLIKLTPYPLLTSENALFSSSDLLSHAVPIGLGLAAFSLKKGQLDFRQEEHRYPHPWKRFLFPLIFYLGAIFALTFGFYFFSANYLSYKEDLVKEEYASLLAEMSKSHEEFELFFQSKNREAKERFAGQAPSLANLSLEEISERVALLRKELQATPDSFPLFANIPRVSDVLAWLTQHHVIDYRDEEGNPQGKLQLENFAYTMIKRPQQGKKNDPYQVKIDLEFSSPSTTWAREFHDALIAPNEMVDPKGEVKWNSNRGRYKTSFFLKDKTIYPGGA